MGAGFDTSYFRLRNLGLLSDAQCVGYFEVDFPQVASLKARAVVASSIIVNICFGEAKG